MNWKQKFRYVGLGFVAGMAVWAITGLWLLWRHPPYHIPRLSGTSYRRWVVDSTPSLSPTGTVWRVRPIPGSGGALEPMTNGILDELTPPATNGGDGAVTP